MVDAIYCISLSRLPERRNECIQLLSSVDFCPVYFLDAVDASMYTKQDFHDEGIYEYEEWEISQQESQVETKLGKTNMVYWQRPVTLGEIGCTVSHYMIWKRTCEMNHKNVLIFEDDIGFEYDKLLQLLSVYDEFSKNNVCDIFYLGCLPYIDNEKVTEDIVRCEFAYLLHAYILSNDAARILVNADLFSNLIVSDEFVPVSYGNPLRKDLSELYTFERKLLAYRGVESVVWQNDRGGSQTASIEHEVEILTEEKSRRLYK